VPSLRGLEERLAFGEDAVGQHRRILEGRVAVLILKSAVLSLRVTVWPARPILLGAPRDLVAHLPEDALERLVVADILIEGGFGADTLGLVFASRSTPRILAARQVIEPRDPACRSAVIRSFLSRVWSLRDHGDAVFRELGLHRLADTPDGADRPRRQEGQRLLACR
jgi:hypothetical protein